MADVRSILPVAIVQLSQEYDILDVVVDKYSLDLLNKSESDPLIEKLQNGWTILNSVAYTMGGLNKIRYVLGKVNESWT